MTKEKVLDLSKKTLPYLLILLVSIFAGVLVFQKGFPNGDDIKFHFAQIYDDYLDLKHFKFNIISENLGSGVGIGKRLFYSPFAHLAIAFLGVILSMFGISLMTSFKLSIILSFFISGVFMYFLAKAISKNNLLVSLIAALVYVLWPYRIYDVFHRIAISEAFSFIFIPLFFYGIYQVINEEEIKAKYFIITIISGALLFLTHNLTAFYTYIFAIIYLLFNINPLIKKFKKKKFILYAVISVFLIFGLMSINLFTQLELMHLNYYVISNKEYMWTDALSVSNRALTSMNFSGFLNVKMFKNSLASTLTFNLIFYVVFSLVMVLIDYKLQEFKAVKPFSVYISGLIYLLSIIFFLEMIEVICAGIITFIVYLVGRYLKSDSDKALPKLTKNLSFYFILTALILALVLIHFSDLWLYMPQIFLNIQFPWRIWTFVQFFVAMGVAVILPYLNNKKVLIITSSIVLGLLMASEQGLIEKRIFKEDKLKSEEGLVPVKDWHYKLDETYLNYSMSLGANKEYCPIIYYAKYHYTPKYSDSLYHDVRNYVFKNDGAKLEKNNLPMVYLEGKGSATINFREGAKIKGSLEVSEDGLVQLPLFYYPGYEIKLNGKKVEVIDTDGLLSFKVAKGSYVLETNFIGSPLRITGYVYFSLSVLGIISFGVIDFVLRKKKVSKLSSFSQENEDI